MQRHMEDLHLCAHGQDLDLMALSESQPIYVHPAVRAMPSSEALNPPGSAGAVGQHAGGRTGPKDACRLACSAPGWCAGCAIGGRRAGALQLTHEQLQELVGIVSAHHRGTAAGPTGWTFEMLCAACQPDAALDVPLKLVNHILSVELPGVAFLLDGLSIGLKKPGGGVRPIAIRETWYRFTGV